MPHDAALISTIATSLVYALVGGYIAARVGLSPIVGYLIAGIAVGPFTPGFVADTHLAEQLAEIGVILLMFGVGMHFSFAELLAVRRIAIPGAIVQVVVATAMGGALALLWGWPPGTALVFGLALSVASTVVLLRALEARDALASPEGHIAIGWLIVEDLAMVLVLVVLPAVASSLGGAVESETAATARSLPIELAITFAKVAGFVATMLVVGARVLPWLLDRVARTGSRELFTLAVVVASLGVAFGSAELFGVSYALGAFFSGILVNASDHSKRAGADARPLQDAFGVLFFVSVGMLFDPAVLLREPGRVAATLAIIILGKALTAFVIVRLFRHSTRTALVIAASLAQIGEFSFVLAALGVRLHLLSQDAVSLIVAGALLSITVNPLIFRLFCGARGAKLSGDAAH